jgi:hypothetical protein
VYAIKHIPSLTEMQKIGLGVLKLCKLVMTDIRDEFKSSTCNYDQAFEEGNTQCNRTYRKKDNKSNVVLWLFNRNKDLMVKVQEEVYEYELFKKHFKNQFEKILEHSSAL